jgi:hypothetical protein
MWRIYSNPDPHGVFKRRFLKDISFDKNMVKTVSPIVAPPDPRGPRF